MKSQKLENFQAGHYEKINDYQYFVPNKINKNWTTQDPEILFLVEKASSSIGKLNSFSELVPDLDLFLQLHLTNEAVKSSRIEGTKTNIDEALMSYEDISPEKRDDWLEVQNYIKAINYALQRLNELPLSSRLLKETHKILLSGVRGKHRNPGQFRRSQNWIGGTSPRNAIYVPPLHTYIDELMSDLEQFIHNDKILLSHLIKIAMIHYQFETIHPFLDGNGRLGRLLITLYLIDKKVIEKPILSISVFFEKNRAEYYEKLNNVRVKNDLLGWIKFFLSGIEYSANFTAERLKKMLNLKRHTEELIQKNLGRKASNGLMLLNYLLKHPVIKIKDVANLLNITYNPANQLVNELEKLGILKRVRQNKKTNVFIFSQYLELF